MNAFNTVNLAAACILTSTEHARKLGIPESKWIYPTGGAGDKDADRCKSTSTPCNAGSTDGCSLGAPELPLQSCHFMDAGPESEVIRPEQGRY